MKTSRWFYIIIICVVISSIGLLYYSGYFGGYYAVHDDDSHVGEHADDSDPILNSPLIQNVSSHYDLPCDTVMKFHNISTSNYVISIGYWEQLTMATDSLCELVNLARGWQSRVVTPFTHNSELYGLPSTGLTKPLSLYYDMKQLNNDLYCNKYRLPPLAPFDEFIQHANRRIILVQTVQSNPKSSSFLNKFPEGNKYMNCEKYEKIKTIASKLLERLNTETKKHKSRPFRFGRACCINTKTVIKSPLEIAEACGFSNTTRISIIFQYWPGYNGPGVRHSPERLSVADTPLFKAPSSDTDVYPTSQAIINNATAFVNDLSCSTDTNGQFMAVHFRTDKLQYSGYTSKTFQACFNEAQLLLNDLERNCSNCTNKCYRYFVDFGEFGSHSFRIKGGQKMTIETFKQNNIKPVHYDPRKYGGVLDSGFVGKVEQLAMAHSSVLILVGRGGYQDQILKIFKELGRGNKAYNLCHGGHSLKPKGLKLLYDRETTI